MMKSEYIDSVERVISRLPEAERADIIRDLEEHFYFAEKEGKTEEEISHGLGSPEKMGKEFIASYRMEQMQENQSTYNIIQAIWAVIGLSLFNLIIVLGPFIALVSIVFAGWVSGASFALSPILLGINILIYPAGFTWFEFFLSLIYSGVGIFIIIGMYYLTKWVRNLFMRYVSWNYRIMKGGPKA